MVEPSLTANNGRRSSTRAVSIFSAADGLPLLFTAGIGCFSVDVDVAISADDKVKFVCVDNIDESVALAPVEGLRGALRRGIVVR